MSPPPVGRPSAADAVENAREALLRKQHPSGAWFAASDMGPVCTAQIVVILRWVGALCAEDAQESLRWLRTQQQADGSYLPYPFARQGTLGPTATAWAAMLACGESAEAEPVRRARQFVQAHGGIPELSKRLVTGDLSLLFLAMVGAVDVSLLPDFPMSWVFAGPVVKFAETRVHAGVLLGALQLGAITRRLKGRWGPDGRNQPSVERLASERLLSWLGQWQNADGSINSNSIQTALGLAAFYATGVGSQDPRFSLAVTSLLASRRRSDQGTWFFAFEADVWTTALNVRALLASGVSPSDERLVRAIDYLLLCQSKDPQPRVNQRQTGAPRVGGWAFQRHNTTMVDCDDTGMVLGVLATYLESCQGASPALDPGRERRIKTAIDLGRKWLKGMQNPDGGWSAFVWGLTPRRLGPIMSDPSQAPRTPKDWLGWLASPPPEFGDPSTEDVTSRALYGLAKSGSSCTDADVQNALFFLNRFQMQDGSFWGRWVVNYLPSTAYAITAAATLKLPRDTVWVSRALEFVLSRQNSDGGFGESELSYADPSLAGRGPSTPPLTALVLSALVDAGLANSDAAQAAARYLLETQQRDGTWSGKDYLATFVPPQSFYEYPATVDYAPLEALSRYEAARQASSGKKVDPGHALNEIWNEASRRQDPLADQAIEAAKNGGLSMASLMMRTGDGWLSRIAGAVGGAPLPSEVERYLRESQQIPAWLDPEKVSVAQRFFRRNSFAVGTSLFFATLPQSYASAEGAKVLFSTYGLAGGTRKRILQTSEFVYTVLSDGALKPGGAGVRICQRIRLGHAAVRGKLSSSLGPTIHQEHQLGTILLLSVVVLDALKRLGVQASTQESEAWVHFWNAVGALLGTEAELLPVHFAEAQLMMERVRARQWKPSSEGKLLTRALIESSQEYVRIPGYSGAMVRYLSGDYCSDILGVPDEPVARQWIDLAVASKSLLPSNSALAGLAFRSTRAFMKAQMLAVQGAHGAKGWVERFR